MDMGRFSQRQLPLRLVVVTGVLARLIVGPNVPLPLRRKVAQVVLARIVKEVNFYH